jgi:hypothetical protein
MAAVSAGGGLGEVIDIMHRETPIQYHFLDNTMMIKQYWSDEKHDRGYLIQ